MAYKGLQLKIERLRMPADMGFVCYITLLCRWSVMGTQNGIQYGPFALPQNGLPIRLSLKKDAATKG